MITLIVNGTTYTINLFSPLIGGLLLLLSLAVLFLGRLSDNPGSRVATGLRWVFWPLLCVWFLATVCRGMML